MGAVSSKLRKSAKGQECTLQIPGVCTGGTETTVLCHGPNNQKGMGNKGDDYHAAFGCHACHEAIDNHRVSDASAIWLRAIEKTQRIWFEKGLLIFPIDLPKPFQSKKVATASRPSKGSFPKGRKLQGGNSFERSAP